LLAAADLVVEAGEEKIRGGVAKRYRHPWDADPRTGPGSTCAENEEYVAAIAAELVRRHRLKEPQTPGVTADAELWVEPGIWEEVVGLVTQASHLVHREARPPRTPGTIRVNLSAAAFQMMSGEAPADSGATAGET
jgi:hypothetical protein